MKLQRYNQLTDAIAETRVETLIEVGVWNGRRGIELAKAALRRSPRVKYHGFDLFESLTDEELEAELSKRPPPKSEVEAEMRAFGERVGRRGKLLSSRRREFDFELHQGYTTDTLPAFVQANPDLRAQFIWIDGGHKVETIANDWDWCSRLLDPEGVAFLDDYYGKEELTDRFGCNQLVERLSGDPAWDVQVMPATDTFPEMGAIQIVRVRHARA